MTKDKTISTDQISPKSWDLAAAITLGLLSFFIYALGASHTIYVGDSGELVAASSLLGIPHPTGYPLYVLLGKLWILLVPIGSIAFRMSLFSAACAAVAVALVYRTTRASGCSNPASVFAASLLAFMPSFWGEGNIQRVYALNAVFVLLAFLAVIRWGRTRATRDLAMVFFVCGLGASNHTIMIVVAAAFALALLVWKPAFALEGRTILAAGGATLLGLLPYGYLPLRSRANPPLDSGDPETLARFLDVILRRDFWHRKWLESWSDLFPIFGDFFETVGSETLGAGLLLAGAGAWTLYASSNTGKDRRGKKKRDHRHEGPHRLLAIFAILVAIGNVLALASHGSREDLFVWHRYYVPAMICTVLLAAIGLDRLTRRRWWSWIAIALPAVLLFQGYRDFDRSRYRIGDDYARTLLTSLPPNSTLVAQDDNILFLLIYLHHVENVRPDVKLVTPGVANSAPAALDVDPTRGAVLFTHPPGQQVEGVHFVPVGLAFQTASIDAPLPKVLVQKTELDGENDPSVPKDYITRQLLGDFHLMIGTTLERESWRAARREFDLATRAAPDYLPLHYNLAITYANNGLFDEAIESLRIANEIAPRGFPRADGSRVNPGERIRVIETERNRVRVIEQEIVASDLGQVPSDSAEYHRAMASFLALKGETLAASGHRFRAEVLEPEP